MNRTDKDLTKTRFTSADEIKCGMLVAFVIGVNPDNGRNILTRGFIRSMHGGVATIPAGSNGTYRVKVDPDVIRYRLTK
jgi:hypothetical protein